MFFRFLASCFRLIDSYRNDLRILQSWPFKQLPTFLIINSNLSMSQFISDYYLTSVSPSGTALPSLTLKPDGNTGTTALKRPSWHPHGRHARKSRRSGSHQWLTAQREIQGPSDPSLNSTTKAEHVPLQRRSQSHLVFFKKVSPYSPISSSMFTWE